MAEKHILCSRKAHLNLTSKSVYFQNRMPEWDRYKKAGGPVAFSFHITHSWFCPHSWLEQCQAQRCGKCRESNGKIPLKVFLLSVNLRSDEITWTHPGQIQQNFQIRQQRVTGVEIKTKEDNLARSNIRSRLSYGGLFWVHRTLVFHSTLKVCDIL